MADVSWDWLSAQQRVGRGRVSDPSQDRLSASTTPDWWWQQERYRQAQTPGLIPRPEDVEALPFGSLADPVSQLAFLAAPGLLRGGKAALDAAAQPGPSRLGRGMLAGERGNLGPPPRSATGEALPESMVRDETGQLQRLYHGTSRVFPDFEMSQSGTGAGGDLYGPGIYMTDSTRVPTGYALGSWTDEARDAFRALETAGEMRDYHLAEAGKGSLDDALYHMEQAQQIKPLTEWPYQRLQKQMTDRPWQFADNPNIRPVYADLKRPFDIEAMIPADEAYKLLSSVGRESYLTSPLPGAPEPGASIPAKTLYRLMHEFVGKEETNARLQKLGYDGITHIGGSGGAAHRVYIAFSPDQVYPSVNVDALRGMSTQSPRQ